MKEFFVHSRELFFTFDGRLNRGPYFGLGIILSIVYLILYVITVNTENLAAIIICMVLLIPLVIAGISLSIRRLHDLNYSGWFILIRMIQFIPIPIIIDLIILAFELYLLLKKGTDGPNDYGDDPLSNDPLKYQSDNELNEFE